MMVFVEDNGDSSTKLTSVECKRKDGSQKMFSVRRATATGIKVKTVLLSTTYHQGPTGMARLGRGRQRASQREQQIKQRKLAETPNSSKGDTWDTCLHVCQTRPHHRLQACGPIRELISSSPLSS
jgi:hypothetical protein